MADDYKKLGATFGKAFNKPAVVTKKPRVKLPPKKDKKGKEPIWKVIQKHAAKVLGSKDKAKKDEKD